MGGLRRSCSYLIQQTLPLLEAAGTPEDPARVINVGSVDGIKTPVFETFSYGPSKAAVHALTKQMAARLVKEGIYARRRLISTGVRPLPPYSRPLG